MNAKKLLLIITAAALILASAAFSACKGDKTSHADPSEQATEAPTQEPASDTAYPTAVPTAQVITDFSAFDKPLTDFCELMADANINTLKRLYPEDYFNSLEKTLEDTLAEEGMTLQDLGFESFDAFIENSLSDMDFTTMIHSETVQTIKNASYRVLSGETLYVEAAKASLTDIIEHLDADKITGAYKLNVDFTIFGEDGASDADNADLVLYEYDGQCYILFA